MFRGIVQILQLLVRLAELESVSKSSGSAEDSEFRELSISSSRKAPSVEAGEHTPPFSLPAPAPQNTAVVSSPVPKKRGRPPKLNRTEDPRTDLSYPSAQKPYQ